MNTQSKIFIGYSPLSGAQYKYSKFVIDDLCVIDGLALWTSNFIPPTKYLPDKWLD